MILTICRDGLLELIQFTDLLPINKIATYTLEQNKDGTILLKFYDKKGKVILPYETKHTLPKRKSARR